MRLQQDAATWRILALVTTEDVVKMLSASPVKMAPPFVVVLMEISPVPPIPILPPPCRRSRRGRRRRKKISK